MAPLPRSLQWATLACAGAGAFVAAAHWRGADSAAADSLAEAVAPAERTGRLDAPAPKPSVAKQSVQGTAIAAAGWSEAPPDRQQRADRIHASASDAFGPMSWLPPPPPPPAAVAPPPAPPTAPPLPFAFVGMVESGTPRPAAFLAMGEALLVVSAGDVLDNGIYRVESLDSSRIVLMHLPTKTSQTIDLTGASK